MRPEKWWSIILALALFMALIPLTAQARPHRAYARHVNRQAFHRPRPRAYAHRGRSQPHRWQQPRGYARGWHGRNRQWQRPRGRAYGWNTHPRQWQLRHNAYGFNGRPGPRQHYRNAYRQNDHRRQWHQPRPAGIQGDRRHNRQFQAPHVAQQHNPGNAYNRIDYRPQAQSANMARRSSGSYSHAKTPAGQFSGHSGFRHSPTSGNTSQP
jgi:hypothetical protein